MTTPSKPKYSVVIPLYNEEDNVTPLYSNLTDVMTSLDEPYEIVFIDDGSTDGTLDSVRTICEMDSRVKIISLRRNFGQTAALKAGFDAARGQIVISMDGDLQHDPEDIPAFLCKIEEGYDIVSGWRQQRLESWLTRRLPSRIANWMMAKLCGVPLHDFGTTFKAYRRNILKDIHLYGELHRFIPALATSSGARITEIPIKCIARQNGKSNYGISRTFRVFLDLLNIKFLLKFSTRPLHFFGYLGLAALGSSSLIISSLILKKLFLHTDVFLQNGPLMIASAVLFLLAIQLICLGLIGEMLSRVYYECQNKSIYAVREIRSGRSFSMANAHINTRPDSHRTRRAG